MTLVTALQQSPCNGFMLSEPVSFESNISVLIGKNGSGKSRFFQSIIEGKTQIFLNKEQLSPPGEIRLFRNNELTPILGTSHSHQTLENDIALFTSAYKSAKEGLKNPQPHPIHVSDGRRELMNHPQFMSTINYIATKTSKEIDQITDDEIKLHYPGVSGNPLGYRDVAATFNRYHKRLNDNDYNIYRAKEKNIDVPNYGPEEFIKLFGREPWLIINEITNKIFDGKFHFPAPDLSSTTYDHTTPLLDKDKNSISTDSLSSGERTLLWLALTLFNTQYQNETLHSTPRLILLDEPDAFLHPKMVKKLFEVLNEIHRIFNIAVILITHSPTTAALAPKDSLFSVRENMIRPTEPDAAISELLDGVTQISVDPRNRKQIYVESLHDKNILESLYDYLKVKTDHLDPQITLTFVSSGKKLSDSIIKEKLEKILGITEPQLVQEFIESLNGIGSCSHVLGTVSGLLEAGASQVKGLIDWDGRNEEEKNIVVLGVGHAYAIENIMLDPICIILYLAINESSQYTFQRFCKSDVNWSEWLKRPDLIQTSVDYLIQEILELDNSKKNEVSYASDLSIEISQSYLNFRGHDLETLLLQKMPQLKKLAKPQQAGILKLQVVRTIMIGLSEGRLIPKAVIDAFKKLQQ